MKLTRILVIAGVVLGMLSGSGVAHADSPVAGGIAFEGDAYLPQFPCGGGCSNASFWGRAYGELAGVSPDARPWTATLAFASFTTDPITYSDTCLGIGTASAWGTIQTGPGATIGTYGPQAGTVAFPRQVNGINIRFRFSWQRAGTVAVIFLEIYYIDLLVVQTNGSEVWTRVLSNHIFPWSTGIATFVPITVPDCIGAGSSLSAKVAGAVEFN